MARALGSPEVLLLPKMVPGGAPGSPGGRGGAPGGALWPVPFENHCFPIGILGF